MDDRPGVRFATDIRTHGARVAMTTSSSEVSYEQLADRVEVLVDRLGPRRRLVLLAADNQLDSVVGYLAALAGGHPLVLAAADSSHHLDALVASFDPDVVLTPSSIGRELVERRAGSRHELHEDLALLLSTSGTTGSSKLVRLSHANVQSNAEAIACYLGVTPEDRAITSLPIHYCYGLSVLNSHLVRGARLVLTELSVLDDCFWDLFRAAGATTFAGVPYTFDLLDRIGFEGMSLPSLRYVTQAGGRLAPEKVRRYAELGRRAGWQLVVMYGQTEATARMAYLPPEHVVDHPGAIGVPIPGGSFRIEPIHDDPNEGELWYRGPNVMLGYALDPGDLALGATVSELATGDLARRTTDGLYEIIGRRSRFAKLFGLRVDLDHVDVTLAGQGIDALTIGVDDALVVALGRGADAREVHARVRALTGLPPGAIRCIEVAEPPRLANGKPDYETVRRLAGTVQPSPAPTPDARGSGDDARSRLRATYAEVLQRDDVTDGSTFVGLGGDSLSYVELSIRLEDQLGTLPADWHTTRLGDLAPDGRQRSRWRRVETSVVLRAVAIMLVVGNHTRMFDIAGGAHVLLGVAGFNFARFTLASGRVVRSVARIAVPSACWIGLAALASDDFDLPHALFVNGQLGDPDARWAYWFIEALIQILVVLGVVLAVPPVRRLERRRPMVIPAALLTVGLAIRFDLVPLPDLDHRISRPHEVLWLFAAGWAAARATTTAHRVAVTTALVAGILGFFGDPLREAVVLVGMVVLVWVSQVRFPRRATPIAGLLAGTSLYIYLTHWQLFPPLLEQFSPIVAWLGSITAGTLLGLAALQMTRAAEAHVRRRRVDGARRPLAGSLAAELG